MMLLSRILIIVLAFFAASLVAAVTMVTGAMVHGFVQSSPHLASARDFGVVLQAIAVATGPAFVIVSVLALVPTMLAVIVAEIYRWRSMLFYVIAGGIVGIIGRVTLAFGFSWLRMPGWPRPPVVISPASLISPTFLIAVAIAMVAGIVAGVVYWAIAGRNAGKCLEAAA